MSHSAVDGRYLLRRRGFGRSAGFAKCVLCTTVQHGMQPRSCAEASAKERLGFTIRRYNRGVRPVTLVKRQREIMSRVAIGSAADIQLLISTANFMLSSMSMILSRVSTFSMSMNFPPHAAFEGHHGGFAQPLKSFPSGLSSAMQR